eukprot:TRINITY_DN40416_c0_g1_i1.p1 TRINITY_DN40416_c0_g1~~TRINITY_DN40416_c0_g1_i1.p1  ORF type:complete len:693 (+),score=97.87 TRINITY_DN40416_c0_g1_i1:232-2079(+)
MPAPSKIHDSLEELRRTMLQHQKTIEELVTSRLQPTGTVDDALHAGSRNQFSAFTKLLGALSQQHDMDVAEALRLRKDPSWEPAASVQFSKELHQHSSIEEVPNCKSEPATNGHDIKRQHSRQGLPPPPPPQIDATLPGQLNESVYEPATLDVEETELADIDKPIHPTRQRSSKSVFLANNMNNRSKSNLGSKLKQEPKSKGKGTKVEEVSENLEQTFGPIGKFVRTPTFDHMSAVVLLSNALFIGVQVQYMFELVTPLWVLWTDYIFTIIFVLELVVRLVGFGCYTYWVGSPDRAWNWFDFTIVTFSTADTLMTVILAGAATPLGNISVLRLLRIVRITRVLRIIRVMKAFKDLRVLLAAIASTLKTGVYAFMLLAAAMWMFGIAVTQIVAEYYMERLVSAEPIPLDSDLVFFFGSLPKSILTLYMTISGGIDWKDGVVPLMDIGALPTIFYLCYTLIMSLCVLNVLTGIFCQAAIETAQNDKDNVIQFQLMEKQRYVETLKGLFAQFDDSGDGKCSLEEFQRHLMDDQMQALLRSLDIEIRDALTLFELLDSDGTGTVELDEFVTSCITLRGGAKAVHMEKMSALSKSIERKLGSIDNSLDFLKTHVEQHRQK